MTPGDPNISSISVRHLSLQMRLSCLNHVMAVFAAAVFSDRDTDTALDATVDATIDDDNIVLPPSHKL